MIVPQEVLNEVLNKAEELYEKEESMIKEIRQGHSMIEVDTKYNYEKMLKRD